MPANVIPNLRYNDPAAAITWLCDYLGFERHMVVEDDSGAIVHAQLVLTSSAGKGMIMLGGNRDDGDDFGRYQKPAQVGTPVTQSAYLVVDDVDALHASVLAGGGTVVSPLQ